MDVKNARLAIVAHDTLASLFLRVIDFVTDDGREVSTEAIFVRNGEHGEIALMAHDFSKLGYAADPITGRAYRVIGGLEKLAV
jgi:hypothetical protein